MRAGFDWKPLLAEGEVLVWEGRPARIKIFVFAAVVNAVVIATWLFAMGEVARAPDGTECFTDDCQMPDGKAGLVAVLFGPVSFLLCSSLMIISLFIRNASAITSKRVLSISRPILRKQPKLDQIPVMGTRTVLNAFNIFAFGPDPTVAYVNRRVVLWAKSRAELKRAITLIEQLSSDETPTPGRTP